MPCRSPYSLLCELWRESRRPNLAFLAETPSLQGWSQDETLQSVFDKEQNETSDVHVVKNNKSVFLK